MIAILTFHHVYNYGAVLQAYGLQKFLQDKGFKVEIIDIKTFIRLHPLQMRPDLSKSYLKYLIKSLFIKEFIKLKKDISIKNKKFDKFCIEYLNLSKEYNSLGDYLKHNNVDYIIVGSDQIWNPKFGKKALETYFLKDIPQNVKRISYAGCIGSAAIDYKILDDYSGLIDDFDFISTRDNFTKDYLKMKTKKNIDLVVDPSLLIKWEGIYTNLKNYNIPQNYIFVYGIAKNTEILLEKLKNKLNLPIVLVGMENEYSSSVADIILNDIGPLDWLELIRNASFVVTKSFHGLMFALKFNKQVLVISTGLPAISRIEDICERLQIKHVIIKEAADIDDYADFSNIINYEITNKQVSSNIQQSEKFILKFLN